MAKTEKNETLYVRNARPNRVVFHYAGNRYRLEHRGNRNDSTSLPIEAQNDPTISRWLKIGQLERIGKDAFMRLGARQVDILPNEYLQRKIRNNPKGELAMSPAEADTTRSLTQVDDKAVNKAADPSPKWSGDLMTTEEELGTTDFEAANAEYPSHHRDSDVRQQMGY
jgi:hypothetical protein